jgi:3-hydroxyisobutyrate dehydrogenase-like beta-hydroxyacid dehydrogenase
MELPGKHQMKTGVPVAVDIQGFNVRQHESAPGKEIDLGYAVDEAKRSGLALETGVAALAMFKRGIEQGHCDEDVSAIVKSLRIV